jgi:hypothetical protein
MPVAGRLTPAQVAPAVHAAARALTRELNRAGTLDSENHPSPSDRARSSPV